MCFVYPHFCVLIDPYHYESMEILIDATATKALIGRDRTRSQPALWLVIITSLPNCQRTAPVFVSEETNQGAIPLGEINHQRSRPVILPEAGRWERNPSISWNVVELFC